MDKKEQDSSICSLQKINLRYKNTQTESKGTENGVMQIETTKKLEWLYLY